MESVVQAPRDKGKIASPLVSFPSFTSFSPSSTSNPLIFGMKKAPCVLWMRFSLLLALSSVCVCLFVCLWHCVRVPLPLSDSYFLFLSDSPFLSLSLSLSIHVVCVYACMRSYHHVHMHALANKTYELEETVSEHDKSPSNLRVSILCPTHTRIHFCVNIPIYMSVFAFVYIDTYIDTCTYIYIHTYIHTYVCIYIYKYIYIYTYM